MYTQCPQCKTLFRIGAEQIRAAAGQVRCGRCERVFDALEHAVGEREPQVGRQTAQVPSARPAAAAEPERPQQPVAVTRPTRPQPSPQPPPPEPRRRLPESQVAPAVKHDRPEEDVPPAKGHEPYAALDEVKVDLDRPVTPPPMARAERANSAGPPQKRKSVPVTVATAPETESEKRPLPTPASPEPFPLRLEAPPRQRHSVGTTVAWSLGVLLLCAGFGLQYIHFHAADVAARPGWRLHVERLCKLSRCELPPRRELSHIELADHTVQAHPRAEGALLITATLRNTAEFPQPYPQVEVRMTDINQRLVAARRFTATEYLAGRHPGGGFPADAEAHLILEVVDPGPEAVSFQFEFH